MKPNNPFILSGYYSPQYFCNRKDETEKLISAIKNNRNITLISLRRMGKTGLIHHVFNQLEKEKNLSFFYLDILPAASINDLINIMSNAIIGKLNSKAKTFAYNAIKFFESLRPVITYNPISGQPSVEFDIKNEKDADKTLEQIFNYIQKQNKKIVIAIDEFQQISNFPEKNIESILRSNIQKLNNTSFIFSGSQKHLLLSIFGSHSRPFNQSTQTLSLNQIDKNEYIGFIEKHFREGDKKIEAKAIDNILSLTRQHTFYVQFLCNRLFSINKKNISVSDTNIILSEILNENEPVFYNYRNLLTDFQFKLLKAIAKEKEVLQPNSKVFISKYKLNTPSSVDTALKALIDKEMIYNDENKYLVYDVFLSRWLEIYQ